MDKRKDVPKYDYVNLLSEKVKRNVTCQNKTL